MIQTHVELILVRTFVGDAAEIIRHACCGWKRIPIEQLPRNRIEIGERDDVARIRAPIADAEDLSGARLQCRHAPGHETVHLKP